MERLIERLATTAMPKAYSEKYLRYLKQKELFSNNNSNEDDGSIFDQSSPGLISRKKNKLGLSLAHNKSTLLA